MNIRTLKLSDFIDNRIVFDYYLNLIYNSLIELADDYPYFNDWFYKKVKRGILNGKREIIFKILGNDIIGISILKKTKPEKKISTLRVLKKYQKRGFGNSLMVDSIEYLETEKPLITVSDLKVLQFENLFNYFGFEKVSELKNYYTLDRKEITYNGSLSKIKPIIRNSFLTYKKLCDLLDKFGLEESLKRVNDYVYKYERGIIPEI